MSELEELDRDPYAVLHIDPDGAPMFVAAIGLKGSGKTHFTRQYVKSWPYDALVIDPTKDFDEGGEITVPWPGGDTWPPVDLEHPEACRKFLYQPNRHVKDHREITDRIVQLGHEYPYPVLEVVDEGRYFFASDQPIPPGADVVLNEGRHGPTFLFVDAPRTVGLRPILWHQADLIAIFGFISINDARDIAPNYGLTPAELQALVRDLEKKEVPPEVHGQPTGFVLLEKSGPNIHVFPPLP